MFNGGWTHSNNGALPNGTNGWADTFLNNNILGQNNNHISSYSRTDNLSVSTLISSWNSSFGVVIYPRVSPGVTNFFNNGALNQNATPNSLGFFLTSRLTNTQCIIQKNSTITTFNSNTTSYITTSFKIGKTGEFKWRIC